MNEYTYINFDDENKKIVEDTKYIIKEYVSSEFPDIQEKISNICEDMMYRINQYELFTKLIYDSETVVGMVAYSKMFYFHHHIIQFIFIADRYNREGIYSDLLDDFSDNIMNPKLAMISNGAINQKYIDAGFHKVNMKNKEKKNIYIRNKEGYMHLDIDEYFKLHVKYLKRFKILHTAYIYTIIMFSLYVFGGFLFHITNEVSVFDNPVTSIVGICFIFVIVGLYFLKKKHNTKGLEEHGYVYTYQDINMYQYKFIGQFEEMFLDSVKAFFDTV